MKAITVITTMPVRSFSPMAARKPGAPENRVVKVGASTERKITRLPMLSPCCEASRATRSISPVPAKIADPASMMPNRGRINQVDQNHQITPCASVHW